MSRSFFCSTGLRGLDKENHKRRRVEHRLESHGQSDSEMMSSSTRTSSTKMTFSEALEPREVLRNLNGQRSSDVDSCDIILRNSSSSTHAHRCILGASCDTFRLMSPGIKTIELPDSTHDVIERIVTFIYTGDIEISDETVADIVLLADCLRIPKLLELCEKFMRENLNDTNCLKFKVLSDTSSFGALSKSIQNYILPRMSAIVRRSDTVGLPVEVLRTLLSDEQTNYAREADVLKLVQDFIASRTEVDVDEVEMEETRDLLKCVEFDYIPPEVMERVSNADTRDWMRRPRMLIRRRLQSIEDGNQSQGPDVVEGILCRGQASMTADDQQVMLYLVKTDAWRVLKQPRDQTGSGLWSGLEAMVTHDGFLYTLSTRDLYEPKYFNRMNLQTGASFILPSPLLITEENTLVSAGPDCLLAIDRMGKVERYVVAEQRWMDYCCTGFPGPSNHNLRFQPVLKGGQLYVLRSSSAGYSFYFSQCNLSIYRLDAVPNDSDSGGHSWIELSQADITGVCDAGRDGSLFGYSNQPGMFSLIDDLGHIRVQLDTVQAKWTTFPKWVTRPGFIRDIEGSAEGSSPSRAYFVASSPIRDNVFVMFDSERGRFKMTHEPPYAVSGLLCHVTLPTASVGSVCRED